MSRRTEQDERNQEVMDYMRFKMNLDAFAGATVIIGLIAWAVYSLVKP